MREDKTKIGQTVYETMCKMFDEKGYPYERHDKDHIIICSVQGDDMPIDILFSVYDDRQIVVLSSQLPFNAPGDKQEDMALAVAYVNNDLIDGSFNFNYRDGSITFCLTESFVDSILGKDLFHYMLIAAANTIDKYNDKFLMISKGLISFEQFVEGEE